MNNVILNNTKTMTWNEYEILKAWEEEAKKCISEKHLSLFIASPDSTDYESVYKALDGEDSTEKANILWNKWFPGIKWFPGPHQKVINEWEASGRTKIVQFWSNAASRWTDIEEPNWYPSIGYRIKPEPKYVPFDYSDAEFLIGKAIKSKREKKIRLITNIDVQYVFTHRWMSYYKLLQDYIFLDGTPCGKLIDEE